VSRILDPANELGEAMMAVGREVVGESVEKSGRVEDPAAGDGEDRSRGFER
jgi:hypothetical protein